MIHVDKVILSYMLIKLFKLRVALQRLHWLIKQGDSAS